jgi:hypothetical protein
MELMVLDVNLVEVPDPRHLNKNLFKRIKMAFRSMCNRKSGDFCEEPLMGCHSYIRALELAARPLVLAEELQQQDRRELDDAVFELLGVADAAERSDLIDRLYKETALHFRAIRVTEIQKMEDRAKAGQSKFAVSDLAADAWDAVDLADLTPLAEWVKANATGQSEVVEIPSERPVHLPGNDMFVAVTVYFGQRRQHHVTCGSRAQAKLVARMGELGITGSVEVPSEEAEADRLLLMLDARHAKAAERLRELAESRSGNPELQEQVYKLLERWYIVGKPPLK